LAYADETGPVLEIPQELSVEALAGIAEGALDVIEERGREAPARPIVPCVDEEHAEPAYAKRSSSASGDCARNGHKGP
jgi:hypothetical protein